MNIINNYLNNIRKFSILSKFFIFLGCLIPFFLVIIIYLFYRIPVKNEPYLINLSGKWKIHEGKNIEWINAQFNDDNWKEVKLPGKFYNQGFRDRNSIIRKKVILKERMINKDLFFIIGGTLGSMGDVYINGFKIGEIGLKINNKMIQGTDSKYGFFIDKRYINTKVQEENVIAIEFNNETIGYDGIQDPRIYIGVSDYLKPYYIKNTFINSFFQYGQIYASFFLLFIILILLVVEWDSEERYKYISTSLLIFSVFFYNLCFSGAFLLYFINFSLQVKLLKASITFICIASLEFIQYYFFKKINLFGKINRFICSAVIVSYFLFNDFVIIQNIYNYFIYYFFINIIYMCIITISDTVFYKTKKYGIIITTSIILASVSGILDLLTNLGIIHVPLFFNISISSYIIMSSVIIITEFISLSYTNKQLTYELKHLNETLESKVEARTKKLAELNRKLKSLNDLKNEFIANITHDFRAPLMAILNLADLSIKDEEENVKENCGLIYDASMKLKNSVDRLLELAKMDEKGVKLKIRKIDPVIFLSNIVDFYSSSYTGNNMKIIKKLPDKEISNFYTDTDKFEEVLNNIISNAIKFTDKNKGKVIVEMKDKKSSIVISIKDNGVGIPRDKIKKLFKRFEGLNGIENSKYAGTGIGLAFSKQLVDYLKGRIWVESEGEGRGSTFYVELKKGIKFS